MWTYLKLININKVKFVEFPAGKMNFDAKTKKVAADKRKGKIRVFHVKLNEVFKL